MKVPYCGAPPVPGETTWNLLRGVGRDGAGARLAAVQPGGRPVLSARIGQHMPLALAAAPLMALGRPDRVLAPATIAKLLQAPPAAWSAALLYAVALWAWHMPGPYTATFRSDALYWLMHLTMLLLATVLAIRLFDGLGELGGATLAGIASMLQMSFLGALLTFAPQAWFDVHAATTTAWGFSPLEDHQLGGLAMWIVAGLVSMAYALAGFGVWLGRLGQRPA